ncbi:MAG: hypothetical protein IH945_07660 [Armatimonadetes bacterium]|nr:hypothetical protein [Armatimonadota bacterium]
MAATPPAFNPAQRQRSGKNVWIWLILAVVFFCILLIVGIGLMVKSVATAGFGLMSCMINGELATNAVLAYALDHDGQFPNAETWQDDVRPYYERLYEKRGEMFNSEDMPDFFNFDVAEPGALLTCNPSGPNETGFAFNSELSGLNYDDVEDPAATILVWETKTPRFNAFGEPTGRSDDDEALKFFGEARPWMDFLVTGDISSPDGADMDLNMDIRPEDGLERVPLGTRE